MLSSMTDTTESVIGQVMDDLNVNVDEISNT